MNSDGAESMFRVASGDRHRGIMSFNHVLKTSIFVGMVLFSLGAYTQDENLRCTPQEWVATPRALKVMSYNVENLFDTENNPQTADEEFMPDGRQGWTDQIVEDKLKNLSKVISESQADIVGLIEIENKEMMDRLAKLADARGAFAYTVTGPSDDPRGIRNGVISKYPIVSVKSHRVWRETWRERPENPTPNKTRDILEVTVNTGRCEEAQLVTLLVNHWPSRRNGAWADVIRLDTAEQLRGIVAELSQAHPARLLLSVGDFNDELQNNSFQSGLNLARGPQSIEEFYQASAGKIFALDHNFERSPSSPGTFFYYTERIWNFLDHMLVAGGREYLARAGQSFYYREGSFRIENNEFVSADGHPEGCEVHGNERRSRCLDGASDHFPVSAVFDLR